MNNYADGKEVKCLLCRTSISVDTSYNIFQTLNSHSGSPLVNLIQKVIKNFDSSLSSHSFLCPKCFSLFEDLDYAECRSVKLKGEIESIYKKNLNENNVSEAENNFSEAADQTEELSYKSDTDESSNSEEKDPNYEVGARNNVKKKLRNVKVELAQKDDNQSNDAPVKRKRGRKPNALKNLEGTLTLPSKSKSSVKRKKKESKKKKLQIHPCSLCGQCFRLSSELSRHLLSHGGSKPYECELCGKRFGSKPGAAIHASKQHGKNSSIIHIAKVPNDITDKMEESLDNSFEHNNDTDVIDTQNNETDKSSDAIINDFEWKLENNDFQHRVVKKCKSRSLSDGESEIWEHTFEINPTFNDTNSFSEWEENEQRQNFVKHEISAGESENGDLKENYVRKLKKEKKSSNSQNSEGKKHKEKRKKNKESIPRPPKHKCEICGKMWRTMSEFKSHVATHSDERPYICEICGQAYKHKPALDVHVGMHNGINPFSCPYCNKAFTQKGALQRHLPIHTGEAPYQCELCGKTFVHHTSFHMHTLAHTGQKSFICKVCGLALLSGSHLKRHSRVHTGERPFECPTCGKRFAERYNLVAHTRVHETNQGNPPRESSKKVHKCQLCGIIFERKSKLEEHLSLAHNKVSEDENRKWYNQIVTNELENQQITSNTSSITAQMQMPMHTSNINMQSDLIRRRYNDPIVLPPNVHISDQDLKAALAVSMPTQPPNQNVISMRSDVVQQQQWHHMVFGNKAIDSDLIESAVLDVTGPKLVSMGTNLDNQHRLLSEMSSMGTIGTGHSRNILASTIMGGHHSVMNTNQNLHIPNTSNSHVLLQSRMFSPDVS